MTALHRATRGTAIALAIATTGLFSPSLVTPAAGQYQQKNLVSNIPKLAVHLDLNLVNPWGITFPPQGPFWISDNGAGVSTLYDSQGDPFPLPPSSPLVVTIQPAGGIIAAGTPTGVVFNGTEDFVVMENGKSGSALFIFATEDGTLSGWSPGVDSTN